MKKVNIDYKAIMEFLKTPRGKAALFFGFYLLFFIVLGIMLGISSSNSDYVEDNSNSKLPFSLSKIEANNYHFKYSYNFDDNINIYEGERNRKKELFIFNNINYYRNDSIFLANNSNVWVKCDNPYTMGEFIGISSIRKILNSSTFISKTDYESGMNVYTYQISTSTLTKLISNMNIDLDDKPNEIIVKTDSDNNVNVIKFDLTSYSKYNKLSNEKGEIELNYTKFGEIKEIKDPE